MKRLLLFLLVSLIASCGMDAQDADASQALLSHIKQAMRFSLFYPQEKVYLHLDNTGYFQGETIWFKAYVTRTDTEHPTDLSAVLYVELLNPSGDVVKRRKLHIENGEAHGDIKVDSLMVTGFYEVRAFTRYMTNWGTNACFSRVIPIFKTPEVEGDYSKPEIDKFSYRHRLNDERMNADGTDMGSIVDLSTVGAKEKADKARSGAVKVRFYPEGGSSVKGLPCRVAFTVADANGKPMETAVSVQDAQGNVLATATTDAEGRGGFTLPDGGVAAKVVVEKVQGNTKSFPLPQAMEEGCAVLVDVMDDDHLLVDLHASPAVQGKPVGYAVIHNGKIVRCDTLTAAPHRRLSFVREKLPEGVSQITFFGSDGHVLAERLFFIYPRSQQAASVKVTTSNASVKPCGKVSFLLSASPHASLSFSALDANTQMNGREGNIRTWMLLSSDLRGYIAHPEYYLESDDLDHRRATDLLMLVQGWRRYDWRLMTGQSMFEKYQTIESQLFLFGRLGAKKFKRKDVSHVWLDAKLYNSFGQVVEGTTQTDSLGNYVFSLPDISGEWILSLNTGIAGKDGMWKDVDYYVGIDRHFSPPAKYVSPQEADYVPVGEQSMFKWKMVEDDDRWTSLTRKSHMLKNVTVKAKGRVWDRTGWNDESSARMLSNIFYDCDEEADRIADEGQTLPGFCEWLQTKNSLFGGEDSPSQLYVAVPEELSSTNSPTGKKKVVDYDGLGPIAVDEFIDASYRLGTVFFYGDGLTYKNRPIVWIVDNKFRTITAANRKNGSINILTNDNHANTDYSLPFGLDEVRSVYVSEDLEGLHRHFHCDEIDRMNPVVLYVYTHRQFAYKQKGIRNTHFQGYNEPSVFQMEDYSSLPPMEDFRRTLFWAPDVQTDAQGKATIEFWNNSSCDGINVSCEGMSAEGKWLVNE